jgi:valyl-tRNA synthetase
MVIDGESFVGMTAEHPITGDEIPFVLSESLKPSFGTGFHSVTPAHGIEDLSLSYIFNLSR